MKQYFVHYFRDFGNTYNLYYAECPEDFAALPDGAERISRRKAEQLCREDFNPRSPHGERLVVVGVDPFGRVFQSTLPARGATVVAL